MTGASERGQEPIDRWLTSRHHEFHDGLGRFIDLGAGLRDAMLRAGHADLLSALDTAVDAEAGLEAIITVPTAEDTQPLPGPVSAQPGSGQLAGTGKSFPESAGQSRSQQRPVLHRSSQRSFGQWQWPPSSLLGSLGVESRERLLERGRIRQYLAGDVLIREGDRSRFVVVLLDGIVKATGLTLDGKEALLAIRVGGDLVGEFAALDDRPRSSTITACGAVVGRVITQTDFLAVLKGDSHLAQMVNQSVLTKLRAANERRIEYAGYDAPTRVARVLRELALRYGDRSGNRIVIRWPITQAELASLAAAAEPTVQKALRSLRASGIIATGYRSLDILDFGGLELTARQVG